MNNFIKLAIEEAFIGMRNNEGGPFGAVIVRNGKVIAKAHNEVIQTNDPTAHAEIVAIRKATNHLGKFDLSDCEIYSTCEPCPMCYAAIHWARMKKLYFGCTREDSANIGFDDKYIYDVISGVENINAVESMQIDREDCLKPFKEWKEKTDKIKY